MTNLREYLESINNRSYEDKKSIVSDIKQALESVGYTIVDLADQKPWGAYFRTDANQAGQFITEFFPGLSIDQARLGIENAELSPKILLVTPGERLSWQYHDRRAERWMFLTDGSYKKSETDIESEDFTAHSGEIVQFQKGERHRLVGANDALTVVAEIWQHSDINNPSDEDDIVRLADDYNR